MMVETIEGQRVALPACMGGWCKVRDRCAQHLLADRSNVAERLCPKGEARPIFYGDTELDAAITAVIREHNEATRIEAQRICDQADAGNDTADPETVVWARQFVERVKPLGRAL